MNDELREALLAATVSKTENQVIIYCEDGAAACALFDIILRIISSELVDAG